MPKSAIRIATALALVAAMSVVAISLLMSGAGNGRNAARAHQGIRRACP